MVNRFKLLALSLLIVPCLQSCGDSNDEPDGPDASKASEMVLTSTSGYGNVSVTSAKFDNQGRYTEIKYKKGYDRYTSNFEYSDGYIIVDGEKYYLNSKGLIERKDDSYSFVYEGRNLVEIKYRGVTKYTFKWEKGNIVNETEYYPDDPPYVHGYKYTDTPNNTGIFIKFAYGYGWEYLSYFSIEEACLAYRGYFGNTPKNLRDYGTYTLNNQGYPTVWNWTGINPDTGNDTVSYTTYMTWSDFDKVSNAPEEE